MSIEDATMVMEFAESILGADGREPCPRLSQPRRLFSYGWALDVAREAGIKPVRPAATAFMGMPF